MVEGLRGTFENPIPLNACSGKFSSHDGLKLRYALFPSNGRHGTVILLQGRNESIEKYYETAHNLNEAGFTVATFDWRGQGGSSRVLNDHTLGHVRSYKDYVVDVTVFFRDVVLPDCPPPFSILAHSMGALVALKAAPLLLNRVHRMVLLAPLLVMKDRKLENRMTWLAWLWRLIGLKNHSLPGARVTLKSPSFERNIATNDHSRYQRNKQIYDANPDLSVDGISAQWALATRKAIAEIQKPEFYESYRIPSLFLFGGSDPIISTPMAERYARSLRLGHSLTIDGAKHELLSECDIFREQVLAAFSAFARSEDLENLHKTSEPDHPAE